ncbi:MAG: methionine gamma-lyase family protein [Bacilli bacterium]|nr:methionine gamma-lyase family protein [Bacilli bacterium]
MINEELLKLADKCERELKDIYDDVEHISMFNSLKVLDAFKKNSISSNHFYSTTGYGYNDLGRETIESVYKDIFKCEDALVRSQFISGTHALTICLFALLRPNDTLLSICGKPYDTLDEVIGIKDNNSSLKSFNVNYEEIDLVDNDFDYKKIEERLKKNFVKVIEIQRSKGYSTRKSISINKVEKIIKMIKEVSPNTIVMIDNCYCEFVSKKEPTEVGADIVVGSLIKNLGAGIASNGAYICGKKDLVHLCSERLNVPGEAKEVGPSMNMNKEILLGLFLSPNVVKEALKTSIFTSKILDKLGYNVEPKWNDERVDIVQNIIFNDKDKLIKYCQGIQSASPIDSNVVPIPWNMPGYDDEVIMASGSFTQGSSIELSCDGPIREPYIAYQQGGLTYQYGKIGVLKAISMLEK